MKERASRAPEGAAPLRFGRLAGTTGFLVRRLHNLLTVSWSRDIAAVEGGPTPVQAGLLILINENPGVTQARLLRALEVESATLVRAVARLVAAGLVEKTPSPSDGRASHLHLTAQGRTVLARVEAAMAARERRLLHEVDPEDLRAFRRVARQLIASGSAEAHSGVLDGLLRAEDDDGGPPPDR